VLMLGGCWFVGLICLICIPQREAIVCNNSVIAVIESFTIRLQLYICHSNSSVSN